MKNCPPGEIISRYLDGELAPGEVARLEQHLAGCPACQKRAEDLGRAGEFLRLASAGDYAPPARLGEMLEEKFFPRPPEIVLGVIECDISTLSPRPDGVSASGQGWAAESPAGYGAAKASAENREQRRIFSGEGFEAAVEFFRKGAGGASCRVTIADGAGRPLAGVRLRLEKSGKPVWSFLTRPGKEPVIPRLLPGRYRLRIERGRSYGLILDLR